MCTIIPIIKLYHASPFCVAAYFSLLNSFTCVKTTICCFTWGYVLDYLLSLSCNCLESLVFRATKYLPCKNSKLFSSPYFFFVRIKQTRYNVFISELQRYGRQIQLIVAACDSTDMILTNSTSDYVPESNRRKIIERLNSLEGHLLLTRVQELLNFDFY